LLLNWLRVPSWKLLGFVELGCFHSHNFAYNHNIVTGQTRTQESDASGQFHIRELPSGSYRLTVTREGDWNTLAIQMLYVVIYAALLAFREHNGSTVRPRII